MDCQTCCGTGELENLSCGNEQRSNEERHGELVKESAVWPYSCPICGGSGFLEDSM